VGEWRLIRNIEAVLIFVQSGSIDWLDRYAITGTTVPVKDVCDISCFVRDLVDSSYMDHLGAEYSRPGYQIGRGSLVSLHFLQVGTATGLQAPDVSEQDLRQAISNAVATKTIPGATNNTCFIVVTPGEVLRAKGLTVARAAGPGITTASN
jgi:hypothetical protein